jgi:hypothetical protein
MPSAASSRASVFAVLGLLATFGHVSAQVGVRVDPRDLMTKEIEAAYTDGAGTKTVIWTTSALPMPEVEKQNSGCARIPEFADGAICYRVCGGGLAGVPTAWMFQWRQAHLGHQTPWESCSEATGCRGVNTEYYASDQRGCARFMIWKGFKHDRDLRIRVDTQ